MCRLCPLPGTSVLCPQGAGCTHSLPTSMSASGEGTLCSHPVDTLSFLMKSKEEAFHNLPVLKRGSLEGNHFSDCANETHFPWTPGSWPTHPSLLARKGEPQPIPCCYLQVQHWVGLHRYLLSDFMNPWPRNQKPVYIQLSIA